MSLRPLRDRALDLLLDPWTEEAEVDSILGDREQISVMDGHAVEVTKSVGQRSCDVCLSIDKNEPHRGHHSAS